jgi:hypothetical protein
MNVGDIYTISGGAGASSTTIPGNAAGYQLGGPVSLADDHTTGNLYLADDGSNGTDPTTGNVYAITGVSLAVGSAPTISGTPGMFRVGSAGSFSFTTSGSPAPTVSVTSGTLPAGLSLSPSGVLSGTPTPQSGGTYSITVTASNGLVPNSTDSFNLVVSSTGCTTPVITSASSATGTAGMPFSLPLTACTTLALPAVPKYTLTAGVLPKGVKLKNGFISGTLSTKSGGSYPITVTVTAGVATGTQNLTLTIDQAPAIKKPKVPKFMVGTAGSYQFIGSGYPVPNWTETGALPSGVTLSSTGLLSGTPDAATGGLYPITVYNSTGVGTPASVSITLTVLQQIAFTSASTLTATQGHAITPFTVSATGFPIPALKVKLPKGLTFTPNLDGTGTISGTPTGVGTVVEVVAAKGKGLLPATQNLTVTINPAH